MRFALIVAALLAVPVSETAAQTRIYYTPDEAVLACKANAGHAIEEEHGIAASPVEPFDTREIADGWRVTGTYVTAGGEERRIQVTCDVTSDGIEVTAEMAET